MIATIIDNHWLQLSQVPLDATQSLIDFFSVKHPRARYIDIGHQNWDGWYRKYDHKRQRLARPFLYELMRFAEEHKIPIEVMDTREEIPSLDVTRISRDMLKGIFLEDHQMRAVEAASKHEFGILALPTGSGKSECAAAIIKLINKPTVVIAGKRIVIEQLKTRLELRGVDDEVGLFYGGSTPDGQSVVVGSIQSFDMPPASLKQKNLAQFQKRFENSQKFQQLVAQAELLIVDECDECSSKPYARLFKTFNGRYKYGLSGTPFDSKKPVEALVIKERMGSIICSATRAEMTKIGRIIPIKYIAIAMGEDGDRQDKTAFDIAERDFIVDNILLHKKVAQIVSAFPEDGTLILVDTNNIEDLGKALEKNIPNSKFIYGKTSKSERKKSIKAFETRELKCLIGSRILKRGLDLAGGCDNLILCGGGQSESDLIQKFGRAVRINTKKWARVFGFFWLNNYYLYKHSREQLKYVINMGYPATVMINGTKIEAEKFIKNKFKIPK